MCVYWCVCSWQRDWSCLFCLCFAHLGFSEALSITEGRIYICQGGNNIKPILMLTLVCTPIHVVRLHDYICVALNKTTHLTLSNNFAVIVAHECEIGFFRWLLHCHGSRTSEPSKNPLYESQLYINILQTCGFKCDQPWRSAVFGTLEEKRPRCWVMKLWRRWTEGYLKEYFSWETLALLKTTWCHLIFWFAAGAPSMD